MSKVYIVPSTVLVEDNGRPQTWDLRLGVLPYSYPDPDLRGKPVFSTGGVWVPLLGNNSGGGSGSGTVGPPGPAGPRGPAGPAGASGARGPRGYSGARGAQGTSGTSGKSGYSGATGKSGYSGATGTSGFSGTTGKSGFSGATGKSGFSGATGKSGYSGLSGRSGYSGFMGQSVNLVQNSSFEEVWGEFTESFSTTGVRAWARESNVTINIIPSSGHGQYYAKLVSTQGYWTKVFSDYIEVDRTIPYYASFKMNNFAGDMSATARAYVAVTAWDSAKTYLGVYLPFVSAKTLAAMPASWQTYGGKVPANILPAGTVYVRVECWLHSDSGLTTTETLHCDQAQLTAGAQAWPWEQGQGTSGKSGAAGFLNMVKNPGFDVGFDTHIGRSIDDTGCSAWMSDGEALDTTSAGFAMRTSFEPHSGGWCALVVSEDGKYRNLRSDKIPFDRTLDYNLSFWCKNYALGDHHADSRFRVFAESYGSGGAFIQSNQLMTFTMGPTGIASYWEKKSYILFGDDMPDGVTDIKILFQVDSQALGGLVTSTVDGMYIDQVQLSRGQETRDYTLGPGTDGFPGQPINLLPNPSFEESSATTATSWNFLLAGPDAVNDITLTSAAGEVHTGSKAVKIDLQHESTATLTNTSYIPINRNRIYNLSCYLKAAWSLDADTFMQFYVDVHDSNLNFLQTIYSGAYDALSWGSTTKPYGQVAWAFGKQNFHADAAQIVIRLYFSCNNTSHQYFYVDDVQLTEGIRTWQPVRSVGYSGKSGYSGYSGFSGTTGKSGYSGMTGADGAAGPAGAPGDSGTSGFSGTSGRSGWSGTTGTSGRSGWSGATGRSGWSGATGRSGWSGATGTSGFSGMAATGSWTSVHQVSHGFSVKNAIYFGGGIYQKAKADDENTLGLWIVRSVEGPDDFTIQQSGYIDTLSSMLVGQYYYVSDITAGALTIVEPAVISNPILFTVSSTAGYVLPFRPSAVGTSGLSGTSGFSGVSGSSGTNGLPGGTSGFSGATGTSGYSGLNGTNGSNGSSGVSGFSGTSGSMGASIQSAHLSVPGTASSGTNKTGAPVIVPYGASAVKARAYAATAPTGSSITVDLNVNGASILSASKLVINAAANAGNTSSFSSPTIAAGDVLTVDFDTVGSTIAGADVSVVLVFERTGAP